jgi:hypothetical protein
MKLNLIGAFFRNAPFGTEIAFQKGLEELGHELAIYDPSPGHGPGSWWSKADATIIWKWLDKGENRNFLQNSDPGRVIVYQPDDLKFSHIQNMMKDMRSICSHALVFNDSGAQLARDMGYEDAAPLIVTADPAIYKPLNLERDIDISFVGSMGGGNNHKSRSEMCRAVNEAFPNLNKKFVSGIFNVEDINEIYNRSKIVLNHATDVPNMSFGEGYGYQCRHFEVGMAGGLLLSNKVLDENRITFPQYDDVQTLLLSIRKLLEDDEFREDARVRYHNQIMRYHNPIVRAAEMISIIKGWL